jgi:hypothetical protein
VNLKHSSRTGLYPNTFSTIVISNTTLASIQSELIFERSTLIGSKLFRSWNGPLYLESYWWRLNHSVIRIQFTRKNIAIARVRWIWTRLESIRLYSSICSDHFSKQAAMSSMLLFWPAKIEINIFTLLLKCDKAVCPRSGSLLGETGKLGKGDTSALELVITFWYLLQLLETDRDYTCSNASSSSLSRESSLLELKTSAKVSYMGDFCDWSWSAIIEKFRFQSPYWW